MVDAEAQNTQEIAHSKKNIQWFGMCFMSIRILINIADSFSVEIERNIGTEWFEVHKLDQ